MRKGRKLQISHYISPKLLAQVDGAVAKTGLSRAALINLALEDGLFGGEPNEHIASPDQSENPCEDFV